MTGKQTIILSQYLKAKMLNKNNYSYENKDEIKILQLTDLHLFNKENLLHGCNTNKSFENIISDIKNDININYDLIFLTGDISQDMTDDSYIFCSNILSQLEHPIFWIPGNHDNYKKTKEIFKKNKLFNHRRYLKTKHWDFIFINSCIEGKDYGYLNENEIKYIDSYIKKCNQEKDICIVMHHHPIPVDTPLIDEVILKNYFEFLEKIKKYPSVKLIMCGHVHGDYSITYNSIKIETSHATCFQWLKGTNQIEIENYAGYTVYKMGKNFFKKFTFKNTKENI